MADFESEIETQLRNEFATREVMFEHHDVRLSLLMPQSAEDLLDEEAFARDERMPYWADLWPSARALARHLIEHPLDSKVDGIELGCGLALPSLALRAGGVDVLATDHNEDALRFVEVNAQRNGLGVLRTMPLDFRPPHVGLSKFDFAIAADVLYESRNATALVDFVPNLLRPNGKLIVADPGRRWAGEFRRRMRAAGYAATELAIVEEPALGAGAASVVEITQWMRRR